MDALRTAGFFEHLGSAAGWCAPMTAGPVGGCLSGGLGRVTNSWSPVVISTWSAPDGLAVAVSGNRPCDEIRNPESLMLYVDTPAPGYPPTCLYTTSWHRDPHGGIVITSYSGATYLTSSQQGFGSHGLDLCWAMPARASRAGRSRPPHERQDQATLELWARSSGLGDTDRHSTCRRRRLNS